MCDVCECKVGVHVYERDISGDVGIFPLLWEEHLPAVVPGVSRKCHDMEILAVGTYCTNLRSSSLNLVSQLPTSRRF